jgi:magnesium-transporting ATPase (P-type)
MADTHGSATGSDSTPPNHLGTTVPSGGLDGSRDPEKTGHHDITPPATEKKEAPRDDDEEEEDMDALIEELESQDGQIDEEEETNEPGGEVRIPEELLATDTRTGLTEQEVQNRRRKYGLNQMKEEKENLILKFLGYFVGPIQFVMEVSLLDVLFCIVTSLRSMRVKLHDCMLQLLTCMNSRLPLSSLLVSKTGLTLVSFVLYSCSTQLSASFRNSKPVQLSRN